MATNALLQLKELGQVVWLDSIRRGHILSGQLRKLVDEDGLTGEKPWRLRMCKWRQMYFAPFMIV